MDKIVLTFNKIPADYILIYDHQEYIKDENNSYVFISTNPITAIGDDGFEWSKCLTHIVIPNSVSSIGDSAFNYCTSLSRLVIPNSVTTIGDEVFRKCCSLTNIVIPDSVTTIGDEVFYECYSLTTIETNNVNAYIIEYCKTHYPSLEVIIECESYILK